MGWSLDPATSKATSVADLAPGTLYIPLVRVHPKLPAPIVSLSTIDPSVARYLNLGGERAMRVEIVAAPRFKVLSLCALADLRIELDADSPASRDDAQLGNLVLTSTGLYISARTAQQGFDDEVYVSTADWTKKSIREIGEIIACFSHWKLERVLPDERRQTLHTQG